MYQTFLSKVVSAALWLLFALGVATLATFPFMVEYYLGIFPDMYAALPFYRAFLISFCMAVGALGLWILMELILIFRTLSGDPFAMRNVTALRRMGYAALLIVALFALKCCYFMTPMTLAGGLFMLLCGLFSLVLSGVFKMAVAFKQENDLTI